MKIKKTSFASLFLAFALVVGTSIVFATNAEDPADQVLNSAVAADESIQLESADLNQSANDAVHQNAVLDSAWTWPLEGQSVITSPYGKRVHPITGETLFHDHIDISGADIKGASVHAALSGTVLEADFDSEIGNYIVIDHGNDRVTFYRHLDESLVHVGDSVESGAVIGTVGQTGKATGPFLAFGIRVDGEAVNPLDYYEIEQ